MPPSPDHIPVTVNLAVTIDAESALQVFGSTPSTMTNIIKAALKVNASSLNGLIEFWEPLNARGDIESHLDLTLVSSIMSYKLSAKALFDDVNTVLGGAFDCKAALPYKNDVSTALLSNYAALPGFGRVALGQVAHAVFGHCAATAAITNDVDFENNMLLSDTLADWSAIKAAAAPAASKANLAAALVKALVLKGYNGAVEYDSSSNAVGLTSITKQVLGQDPNRARDQDNNVIAPEVHQPLKFYADDTIYMSINVKYPSISMSDSSAVRSDLATLSTGSSNTTQVFDLEIKLA